MFINAELSQLPIGDGRKAGTDVGPMINENAIAKAERYVDIGQTATKRAAALTFSQK